MDRQPEAKQLLGRSGWSVSTTTQNDLIVEVQGQQDIRVINDRLVHAGIGVYHLDLETPSLEDVFISLTDHRSTDGG